MTNNYSHTMMNFSDSDSPCPDAISIFFTTSTAFLSMVAVLGNILVIVAVYKTRNLRTSTNYYYVNMAISDFLSSLTIWPLYLSNEIITSRGSLFKGSLATAGCKVGVFFRMTSVIVSILSLVLIAVDRFPIKINVGHWESQNISAVCDMDDINGILLPDAVLFQSRRLWSRNLLQICME